MMKKLLFACAASALLFTACEKEDEPQVETPAYEFKNQTMQGKIEGKAFQFEIGTVEESGFGGFLYQIVGESDSTDACAFVNQYFGNNIVFGLDELKTGLTVMGDNSSQTVTFYQSESENNDVAIEGAIEILTVNAETDVVTGRIDARIDDNNFVNGNFSVTHCK